LYEFNKLVSTQFFMVGEFEFIEKLRRKYSLGAIGDDCAVLPKDEKTDQVITADLLVEDIDFRLDWTKPEFLGHKALAISLSDIAAMGAEPKWAMLSLGIPENVWHSDFIDRFYDGWFSLADEFNVELIGGDVSRVPERLVIDSIVIGEVAKGKAILRSGARPGDLIFVTGKLGGAAAGLQLMKNGLSYESMKPDRDIELTLRQLQPLPQVNIAKLLKIQAIVTSMIDISDGLSSDLMHLCKESGVGAKVYADRIPVDENLRDLYRSEQERLEIALNGGEDFELLFTVPEAQLSSLNTWTFLRSAR
jgi:thiamine-monophosphate kinase